MPGYSTKYFPLISTTVSNRDLVCEGQIPRMAGKGEKAYGKGQGSFPLSESSQGSELLFPLKEGPHYVAQAGLEHTPFQL